MRRSRGLGRGTPFDPDRVAQLEAAGWRAYYDRSWFRLLRVLVILCQEQFCIPLPVSLVAAYHATRAAIAWVPYDHSEAAVTRHYERFYRLAKRYAGLTYDPAAVAKLELRYNDLHRRKADRLKGLAPGSDGRSPSFPKDALEEEYLEAMVELHSAIFALSNEQVRESAEARVRATDVVDGITGGRSLEPQADWARVEALLRDCYRSLQKALQHPMAPP